MRLPEPWEHRGGEVHSDVGGQACSEVMGEKRENSHLGKRNMCSGLDVRREFVVRGGWRGREEGRGGSWREKQKPGREGFVCRSGGRGRSRG